MKTSSVCDPFNGEIVGSVSLATELELADAIGAASEAFGTTCQQTPLERSQLLDRVVEALRRHEQELVELLIAEAGKPRKFAEIEIARAQMTFSFAAHEALRPREDAIEMEAS